MKREYTGFRQAIRRSLENMESPDVSKVRSVFEAGVLGVLEQKTTIRQTKPYKYYVFPEILC